MMRKELFSAIVLAIIGFLVAFFVCNIFSGKIEDFRFKSIDSSIDTSLSYPDQEVFNYKAINPTVEVYVGQEGS